MTICMLGRQPAISLAELEAIYGSDNVRPLGKDAALVEAAISPIEARRLGGSIKVAELLGSQPTTDLKALVNYCRNLLPILIKAMPEGKIRIGVSAYGLNVPASKVNAAGLDFKRIIKNLGRSVRTVPNSTPELSSAQVMHNKLASSTGLELLLIRDGRTTHIARTSYVQDINSYTLRDRGRPKRDAFIGMLPPKLAQVMINLASLNASAGEHKNQSIRILDPFCGTGVVLQEAALMGFSAYGTDISPKMVEYSTTNLDWLRDTLNVEFNAAVELGDATHYHWSGPIDAVVCEGYLGKPQRSMPSRDQLEILVAECDNIMRGFLKNIHGQLQPGTPLVVAVPAWKLGAQFRHLPLVQNIEELGYQWRDFSYAAGDELLYYREDQFVARQLLVITKQSQPEI